jgi:multidrug efflux pump subunit AcrA (membrane-fusion protein)
VLRPRSASDNRSTTSPDEQDRDDDHAGHGHEHAAHSDPNHIDLSPQAQRNIGLRVGPVSLQTYERTVTIPGMIVERPGRTSVAVAAPLSGVITHIYAVEGEAVASAQKLFRIRLTHEEIVQAQGEFLKTVAELDVTGREVKRLEAIAAEGAIPGKAFLELRYEQEKQQAVLNAQREALLLHGLTEEQVATIQRERKLLPGLTVFAPTGDDAAAEGNEPVWQIQELNVSTGQHVDAGDTLAVLTDYRTLFIEGTAFEQDTTEIQAALAKNLPITAVIESGAAERQQLEDLKIVYTAGRVDPASRTFSFYVSLPNPLVRDATNPDGHRFVDWQFKPGQRVQLRVPVESWRDSLVLPVGAVAREGAESYVFQVNGNSFHRRPVHEKYRDQLSVVIANDGSIFPGDHVALSGAQQLQIALKNKSGGAIDPHAGHHH